MTHTIVDYRRTDLRTNVLYNPYWITSAEAVGTAIKGKAAVFFSFPTAGEHTIIHQIALEVTTSFKASAAVSLRVGFGALARDAVTTGSALSADVDSMALMAAGDVSAAVCSGSDTGMYYIAASATDFSAAAGSNCVVSSETLIKGKATNVPVIYAIAQSAGTINAGKFRLHLLISKLPD